MSAQCLVQHRGPLPSERRRSVTTARLFLALWPDARTRVAVRAWQDAMVWPKRARQTWPENLHVTVQFIGSVPAQRVPELCHGLALAGEPIDLELDHIEIWPHGVVVLAPAQLPPELTALKGRLAKALQALDAPCEGPEYRPHVTLARHAAATLPVSELPQPVRWRSTSYVLALSAGGHCEVLHEFPLHRCRH